MSDPVFEQEQQHLEETYEKLLGIERDLTRQLDADLAEARKDREDMLDELAMDFGNGVNLETYVELEAMHQIMDTYNRALDIKSQRLAAVRVLLMRPYFAKLTLQFPTGEPRDLYLGAAGMTDEMRRHFIIDWRSPVAEVYYNQANGRTSYEANGRTIEVDLKLRRQFDLEGATLHSYFDTTVAIQDPLLLQSLKRNRSSRLTDITATIQKEQNQVIRHEDVPALLVAGIAGSGKTSVLLQRIAFLLYRHRDDLRPKDVYLITPNRVFARYIANVLPDMGESNPQTLTWDELMGMLGVGERGLGREDMADSLRLIDERLVSVRLEQKDMTDIHVDDERVLTASQVYSVVSKFHDRIPAGQRLAALVSDELVERIEQRAKRLSTSEDVQDFLFDLPTEEQFRIFGQPVSPQSDDELRTLALKYLNDKYQRAIEAVYDGQWLRVDRIGMRMLGKQHLDVAEYLYLKMALAGTVNREARFVMVDEVQDYTESQLMVLARYFSNAHFLLLGDENQAIREGTASFARIRDVFETSKGSVSECRLLTSYRSSPEITNLFKSLMPASEGMEVQSVQESGIEPVIRSCSTVEEHRSCVLDAIAAARDDGGLSAVIAANKHAAEIVMDMLGDDAPPLVDGSDSLPESGVFVTYLKLAKGLEFDSVIIPDASASVYPDNEVSRHRLYTAVSRATKRVTILCQGTLTPLLSIDR